MFSVHHIFYVISIKQKNPVISYNQIKNKVQSTKNVLKYDVMPQSKRKFCLQNNIKKY